MARSKKSAAPVPAWAWALGVVSVGGVAAYLLLRRRTASAAAPPSTGTPTLGGAFDNLGDAFGGAANAPTADDLAATGMYLFGGPTDTPLLGIDPVTGRPTTPRGPRMSATSPRQTSTPAPDPAPAPAPAPAPDPFATAVLDLQNQLRRLRGTPPHSEDGAWSRNSATWTTLVSVLNDHPSAVCSRINDYFVPQVSQVIAWTDCLAQIRA